MITIDVYFSAIAGTIFVICFGAISFFLSRTLRHIDANQAELFKELRGHEKRLSHLEGEHAAVMKTGAHAQVVRE